MNTNFNPFRTQLGEIRPNGDSIIQYRIEPNVQWAVKNYGTADAKWYSRVADSQWRIKEYPLGEREIAKFKTAIEKQTVVEQQRKQFYSEINKPLANVNYVDFPKASAFTISQHEYGITTAKSRMPILGTFGAGPCVILALYDDKNKIAALVHADSVTEVESFADMVRNFSTESTIAHLYGGDQSSSSFRTCLDIIEFIKNSGIKIENCALIEHSNGNASLAIDARNGRLYSLVKPSDLTSFENLETKLEQLGELVTHSGSTALAKGYDGLVDSSEVNLVNENMDLPEAQPLTPGWDMTLSGTGLSSFASFNAVFSQPNIEIRYSLQKPSTGTKMAAQTTGGITLGIRTIF